MEYLKIFGDPKNDFINLLIYKLSHEIRFIINSIYNSCKNEVNNIEPNNNVLYSFQKLLEEIPKWDKIFIKNETNRIKQRIPIIEDLLTCVLISNTRLLCAFNTKLKIKIPKLTTFVHKCYTLIAKELWQSTYLFEDKQDKKIIQQNKRIINNIINSNIENAIRIYLPIKSILKYYIENNLNDDNTLKISNTLDNILKTNKDEEYLDNKDEEYLDNKDDNNDNDNNNNTINICNQINDISNENKINNLNNQTYNKDFVNICDNDSKKYNDINIDTISINLTTVKENENENDKDNENFNDEQNYEIFNNCIIDKEIPLFNKI
tara:strand:+ start:762 stop:1724 length:963 start_codon:yes stop_codon:yes gene_type:complete